MDHGPKLSSEQYQRCILALYEDMPPAPDRRQQTKLARRELDLLIDYKLGIDFPADRRGRLWDIHDRYRKRFLGNLLLLFSRTLREYRMGWLVSRMLKAYREVLSEDEFVALFEEKVDS